MSHHVVRLASGLVVAVALLAGCGGGAADPKTPASKDAKAEQRAVEAGRNPCQGDDGAREGDRVVLRG